MKWFSRLPFQFKIFAGFIIIICIAVMITLVAVIQFSRMHAATELLNTNWMPSIKYISNISNNLSDYSIKQYQHISTTDRVEKRIYEEKMIFDREQIRKNQADYENLIISEGEKKLYKKVLKLISAYFEQSVTVLEFSKSGEEAQAITFLRSEVGVKAYDDLDLALNELMQINVEGGQKEANWSESIFYAASGTITTFLIMAIVISLLIAYFITRDIYLQIGGEPYKIADIAQNVCEGNLDINLPDNKNESGIYRSVKKMVLSLKEIATVTATISQGDMSKNVSIKGERDILASNINQMISNFKTIIYQTSEIAKGNFNIHIEPRSEADELGKALQVMNDSLVENKAFNQNETWIKDGMNGLSQELSGDIALKVIAQESINYIARYVGAGQGALYLIDNEEKTLSLYSSFAYVERNHLANKFKFGEGIVGQVAFEKKPILLKNLQDKEAQIQSGLVSATPNYFYAMPLLYEDALNGVIELASFEAFDSLKKRFLVEANKIVATYIHSAIQAEEVKKLLVIAEEAKQTAEDRAIDLQQSQEELKAQAELLKKTNAEIEELNQNLETKIQQRTTEIYQQKEEIEAQRDNLEKTFHELENEKQKSDELLLNILPIQIAEELKAQGKPKPRHYQLVTVMFTDFEGFTKISSQLSSDELVTALNKYFEAFDRIMEKHQIEKIKTIGDAYMAAGGIPEVNFSNPIQAVLAGLEIQKFMQKHSKTHFTNSTQEWNLRVGINTGELIAGVIGKKKFAYDIWGDAVNVASRMESNSVAGKVNISENTYQLVKDFFECEFRGQIEVKGKGAMNMYFVHGIKPELSKKSMGLEINQAFEDKLQTYLQSFEVNPKNSIS
jgi:class 3 adenylate cyclase/CHASE3 domain sensor protein